ncbi:hypothetical protein LT493_17900 [Streptomyces tricolor]|nr:hypothetical protein [Streptomyces tricolor]
MGVGRSPCFAERTATETTTVYIAKEGKPYPPLEGHGRRRHGAHGPHVLRPRRARRHHSRRRLGRILDPTKLAEPPATGRFPVRGRRGARHDLGTGFTDR